MARPLIVVGDSTNHGGTVLSGSPASTINGKPIARIGDKVSCSKEGHDHTTTIVTGDPTLIIDGKPAARDGDQTDCGARLIATQLTTRSL